MSAPLLDVDLEALVDIELVCEAKPCSAPAEWAVRCEFSCSCPPKVALFCDPCLRATKDYFAKCRSAGLSFHCGACDQDGVAIQLIVLTKLGDS